jgi:hypothetical protein
MGSVEVAARCLEACSFAYLTSTLLPGICALAPPISDSILATLPDFCDNLRENFPDHFADLTSTHILPVYSLTSCTDQLADTIASILLALPMRHFTTELPRLAALCPLHFTADVLLLLVDRSETVWSGALFAILDSLS